MAPRIYKVLIVDDSPSTRDLISAMLEQVLDAHGAEMECLAAESGLEALRHLPANALDLIITDINMPDVNGLELISFARRHPLHLNTPMLVISTQASQQDRSRALDLGADRYCEKPIQLQEFTESIAALLRFGGGTVD